MSTNQDMPTQSRGHATLNIGSEFAYDSPAAAVGAIERELAPLPIETIALDEACGRVLGERIVADRPSPALDVSAMDGYAVRLADLKLGDMTVAGEISIGRECPAMPSGAAMRIVTGAPVPADADAVIKREDVDELGGSIRIRSLDVKQGQCIRRRGENIEAGGGVLEPGILITPAVVGALASFGVTTPRVHRRVRVAIIVTGDEVLAAESSPKAWQLRDSNGPALAAMTSATPWISLVSRRSAPDDPAALREAVSAALAEADAIFLTGGVSMGNKDFVPGVLRELGVRTLFHKLPQRPGKPVLCGIAPGEHARPVFALPGNPVSVLVTARRLATPGLRRLAGFAAGEVPVLMRLDVPAENRSGMWWHRPVRRTPEGWVALVEGRGSGDFVHAARADGFIEMPPGASGEGPWAFRAWGVG